jgi:two-component system cell cycle response regulator
MTNYSSYSSGSEHREAAPTGLKVLIIEDDAGDFGLVMEELQYTRLGDGDKGPKVTWAKTLSEGLADAHAALPDVILLDLSLPDSTGVATLESVVAAFPSVPVVVFTSSDDDSLAIEALNCGAQDYLVKGQFDRYALKRSIRFASIRGQMEQRFKLFESALNSAADGIEITDSTGRITWVNHAYLNMTGYNATDVIGRTPGELLKSGIHDPAIYQQMWQTISSGKVWRGEVVNKRKDGSLYHEMLNIAPVISAAGTIQNFVATKQDI